MIKKIRILFISANPWTTSRILVDEEERQIFEKLQEGSCRDSFELYKHTAIRSIDLQRLLMMYEPDIVHFSGHASKSQKIILGGTSGRGKEVDRKGLVEVFALYKSHVRLVLLNACFTRAQALSLSEVIDYTVGTGRGLGDKGGVAFAGAFYRALGFGKSVKEAFASARAELGLTRMPRTGGIELFVRDGVCENDQFPQTGPDLKCETAAPWKFLSHLFPEHSSGADILRGADLLLQETSVLERTESSEAHIPQIETSSVSLTQQLIRHGKDGNRCEPADKHLSCRRRQTAVPLLGLRASGANGSSSRFATLRKTKRAKRANSGPDNVQIDPLSSTDNYLAMTVRVRRIVLRDGAVVSQAQVARGDQTCRTCARFADTDQTRIRGVKTTTKKGSSRQVR